MACGNQHQLHHLRGVGARLKLLCPGRGRLGKGSNCCLLLQLVQQLAAPPEKLLLAVGQLQPLGHSGRIIGAHQQRRQGR